MKWIIIVIIVAVGIASIAIALPLLHAKKYDLFVEAVVEKNGQREVKRVVIENTGLEPLTGILVYYGPGHQDSLPSLEPRQKVFLSPPAGSMDNVTITTNGGIQVTKTYELPTGLAPPGFSG